MSMLTAPARRGLAGAAAVALVAGAAVATAPATTAAPTTATGVSATWGVKESWRSYMKMFDGSTTVAGGVTTSPEYGWPAASTASSYDPSTRAGTVRLSGSVTYAMPSHTINEVTFANPTVVLSGKGGGRLLVDVTTDLGAFPGEDPAPPINQDQVYFADLSGATPTQVPRPGGTTVTYAGLKTVLTDAGAKAFAGQYTGGTEIDPVTVRFDVAQTLKASSTTKLTVKKKQAKRLKAGKKGKVVVKVAAAGGVKATGKVVVKDRKKTLRTKAVKGKKRVVVKLPRLKRGKHVLRAVYQGDDDVRASKSTKTKIKVKRKKK